MAEEPATGPVAVFCADLRELLRGSGRTAVGLAQELRMSRGQIYAILNGEVKRPPDFSRVVEPLVRACGADEAEIAQWRKRHDVLEQVYEELRRQHRRTATPAPVEGPAPGKDPTAAPGAGPEAPPGRPRRLVRMVAAVAWTVLVAAVSSLVTAHLVRPVPSGSPCTGKTPDQAGADLLDVPHAPPAGDPRLADWWRNDRGVEQLAFDRHTFTATVRAGTANRWDLMVVRSCLPLVTGRRYALSFTARATAPVTINVRVQDSRPPDYTPSLDRPVELTTTGRPSRLEFAGAATNGASELEFQLGGAPARQIKIEDVRLVTA